MEEPVNHNIGHYLSHHVVKKDSVTIPIKVVFICSSIAIVIDGKQIRFCSMYPIGKETTAPKTWMQGCIASTGWIPPIYHVGIYREENKDTRNLKDNIV